MATGCRSPLATEQSPTLEWSRVVDARPGETPALSSDGRLRGGPRSRGCPALASGSREPVKGRARSAVSV